MSIGPYVREQRFWPFARDLVRLYRDNFWPIFIICAVFFVPYWVLLDMAPFWLEANLSSLSGAMMFASTRTVSGVIINMLAAAVLVATVHDICIGNRPSVSRSFRRAKGYLGALLVVTAIEAVLLAVGLVLLVIPALIIMIYFLFSTLAVVVEQKKGWSALRRSAAIVHGSFWRVFGYLTLVGMLADVSAFVMQAMIYLTLIHAPDHEFTTRLLTSNIIENLVLAIFNPLYTITVVLLYYDLRARKDAIDIQHIELETPVGMANVGIQGMRQSVGG